MGPFGRKQEPPVPRWDLVATPNLIALLAPVQESVAWSVTLLDIWTLPEVS